MAKKKNKNSKAALPPFGEAVRKPSLDSMDSRLNATIVSAPRRMKVDDASVFMRTTAFAIKNKIRTAFTELGGFETSRSNRKGRPGLQFKSSSQPGSSSFFAKPANRLKMAFLTLMVVGGVSGYLYLDRPESQSVVDAPSHAVPKIGHVQSEFVPVADDGMMPSAFQEGTDILSAEPHSAPKAAVAPVSKVKGKNSKAVKSVKAAKKSKAGKAGARTKAKAKSKSKAKKSASR